MSFVIFRWFGYGLGSVGVSWGLLGRLGYGLGSTTGTLDYILTFKEVGGLLGRLGSVGVCRVF